MFQEVGQTSDSLQDGAYVLGDVKVCPVFGLIVVTEVNPLLNFPYRTFESIGSGSGSCISCAITCVKATKQSRIAVKIECLFIYICFIDSESRSQN